jgi:hypothetical protein
MEVSNLGLLCLVLWWSWCRLGVGDAPGVVSVATILGTVSSVTGSKVPIHFQVVASGEQERSSSLRRWMWQGPHTLCIHVGCAGAATGVSSYARLESGDRRWCVRGSRMFTLLWRSLSGHSGLQRAAVRRGIMVASSARSFVPFSCFSPRMRWCRVSLGVLLACIVVVVLSSARDVQLLFFLNDMAVLPPLIFFKSPLGRI